MARRREQTVEHNGDDPILPRHVAEYDGLSVRDYREHWTERNAWFVARGIDPGDWGRVYPVLKASWESHRLNRAATTRMRLRVADQQLLVAHDLKDRP